MSAFFQANAVGANLEPPVPVPPAGSRIVGQWEDGRPIYEREETVFDREPMYDANGKEVWRKHATTGEPITQRFRSIPRVIKRRFILEPMPNRSVVINYDFEGQPEDVVAAGYPKPGRPQPKPSPRPKPAAATESTEHDGRTYPHHLGFGEWELSDGSRTPRKTKRAEAEQAESALAGV